jgi:hypothetical protein
MKQNVSLNGTVVRGLSGDDSGNFEGEMLKNMECFWTRLRV